MQANISPATKRAAIDLLNVDFRKEIQTIQDIINNCDSPIVFSHNDLQQGNILLPDHSKKRPTLEDRIVFIDFEYCSYNYRGFDIANHFCEWCFDYNNPDYPHFTADQDRFPSEFEQRYFVRQYFNQLRKITEDAKTNQLFNGSHNGSLSISTPPESACNDHQSDSDFDNSCDDSGTDTEGNVEFFKINQSGLALDIDDEQTHVMCIGGEEDLLKAVYNSNNLDEKFAKNNDDLEIKSNKDPQKTPLCRMNGNNDKISSVDYNAPSTNEEETDMIQEIQPFIVASHLLWTLWAMKNAHSSQIKFGYWVSLNCDIE